MTVQQLCGIAILAMCAVALVLCFAFEEGP